MEGDGGGWRRMEEDGWDGGGWRDMEEDRRIGGGQEEGGRSDTAREKR